MEVSMKSNKYLLVVVDYDSEILEVHSLKDVYAVHEYFTPLVADEIIKFKKFKGAFEEANLIEVGVDSYFKGRNNMEKVLVKYNEDFYYGIMSGLFICTKDELEALNGAEIDFGSVLGKHSEVTTDGAYEYCEIVSEDQDLIHDLLTVFGSNNISGYNPLDYVIDLEDEGEE